MASKDSNCFLNRWLKICQGRIPSVSWSGKELGTLLRSFTRQSSSIPCLHEEGDSPFNEYVSPSVIHDVQQLAWQYKNDPTPDNYLKLLYNIPSGIELTDHIVTNYGQLKTMWYQRHNHRLPEWRKFCDWILTLPQFCVLTGIKKEKEENED